MNMREARQRRRLSLRACADALHEFDPSCQIDFATLAQFEAGRRPWPSARATLARFFNVTEAELFEDAR